MSERTITTGTWKTAARAWDGETFEVELVLEGDGGNQRWRWRDADGSDCEVSGETFDEAIEVAALAWRECSFEPPLEELTLCAVCSAAVAVQGALGCTSCLEVTIARLHFVTWPDHPEQPSWLVTTDDDCTGAVGTILEGLAQRTGNGPSADDLECEELVCSFVEGQLRVKWPDGQIEELDPTDDLCGQRVADVLRSWAEQPGRNESELTAADRFLSRGGAPS